MLPAAMPGGPPLTARAGAMQRPVATAGTALAGGAGAGAADVGVGAAEVAGGASARPGVVAPQPAASASAATAMASDRIRGVGVGSTTRQTPPAGESCQAPVFTQV